MSTVRGYAQRIELSAPVSRVWRALHLPEELNLWLGTGAVVQPQVGGNFDIVLSGVVPREGHIDVFEPERRLRIVYLSPPSMAPQTATIVDDYLLTQQGSGCHESAVGVGRPVLRRLKIATRWRCGATTTAGPPARRRPQPESS